MTEKVITKTSEKKKVEAVVKVDGEAVERSEG